MICKSCLRSVAENSEMCNFCKSTDLVALTKQLNASSEKGELKEDISKEAIPKKQAQLDQSMQLDIQNTAGSDLKNLSGNNKPDEKIKRKISFKFFLGILIFAPFCFWLTFRSGHSWISRILSVIWMPINLFYWLAFLIVIFDNSSPPA